MAIDIQPGNKVNITVTMLPTNQAAAKTLSRLFAKDPANGQARRRRKKLRQYATDPRRRGGRIWMVRPRAPRLFQPLKGDACNILATCDVIGDLRSVERFVEVKPEA